MLIFPSALRSSSPAARSPSPPARRIPQRDLAGTIRGEVITKLKEDQSFSKFVPTLKAFGRFLAPFISSFLESGSFNPITLENGFNLDQWNSKNKVSSVTIEEKQTAITLIVKMTKTVLSQFYLPAKHRVLLKESPSLLLEILAHLRRAKSNELLSKSSQQFLVANLLDLVKSSVRYFFKYVF